MSGYRRPRRHAPADRAARGGVTKGGVTKDGATKDGATAGDTDTARRRDVVRRAVLPRRAAYDVLAAVRNREAYANLLLPRLLAERGITGRDAALATELAYGTLRGQGTYDAVLAACSDRPLSRLDPPVLHVLRLGTHQLLATRVGAHAAVATSVDLARSVAGPRVSGYVNAVLRRVATRDLAAWLEIVAPDPTADHDGYLAVRYSHPGWIVAAYREALGEAADTPFSGPAAAGPAADGPAVAGPAVAGPAVAGPAADGPAVAGPAVAGPAVAGSVAAGPAADGPAVAGPAVASPVAAGPAVAGPAAVGSVAAGPASTELEAALAAGNARPHVTLAAFPAGRPRAEVMPPDAVPGRWSRYAFTLHGGDPAGLVAVGEAAVQDEGSQLAAIALARASTVPRSDRGGAERWLDMCAGPGGKSRLLYGLAAQAGAALVAGEVHPHRAALVHQALAGAAFRAPGAPPPREVIVADGTRSPWRDGIFDRVLVDAPCSGLGALRRRPEARWRKAADDIPALAELQRALLATAIRAVRPGGVVGYVTCSPVPAETRDVVDAVVAAMPDIEILDASAVLPDVPETRSASPMFAQLWPHRHGTDAIFIALLRRGTH